MDPTALGISWKKQLWHKWKTLRRIPFRKSWFIGYDLEGNSYWEMVDHNNPHRLRRKVSLDRPYFHFSDYKPHPMWMQWLQFTRPTAPTLVDLINDAKRQYRLKLLTKQAEDKWRSVPLKPSMGGNSDPRLDTAWGGQPVQSAAHPEAESAESAPEYQPANHADALSSSQSNYQQVLEEMAKRQKNDPKVVRDHLGQVKVEKSSKGPENHSQASTSNTTNTQAQQEKQQQQQQHQQQQAQQTSEWPAPEEPAPEKPESAMFKPKQR